MSMFGFPLLRSTFDPLRLTEITFETLMKEYFGEKKVDLTDAKLLDTYAYVVNGVQYEQKVYRLRNHSIFVETDTNYNFSIKLLEEELKVEIARQEFEKAATLRDKISLLKKNQTPR